MGEVKSRSIRLDDENWEWLSGLPGRTSNDAVGALRGAQGEPEWGRGLEPFLAIQRSVEEVLELARSVPDEVIIESVVRRVLEDFKAQRTAARTGEATPSTPAPTFLFNPECAHCKEIFGSMVRGKTICPECKKKHHQDEPRNCPVCTLQYGTGAL